LTGFGYVRDTTPPIADIAPVARADGTCKDTGAVRDPARIFARRQVERASQRDEGL
jgi:hypothetical protein